MGNAQTPFTRLAPAIMIFALAAAGCGGGSASRLSEEEFRQQANTICDEFEQKISDLDPPTSPDRIPDYVDQVIPLIEQGLAELRQLTPPEELEADYDAMLDETAKAIPAARALGEAAADQDAAAVQDAIAQAQQADEASNRIASELGLDSCAQEG
jgi:hypothetical protein